MELEIILYVANQALSRDFYIRLLGKQPELDVPGMTEFRISEKCKLGLMPNKGIARILGDLVPNPESGTGIPRCELYLRVKDSYREFENALKAGARFISPVSARDWGEQVGYLADPDGHIIAFAETIRQKNPPG